MTGLSNKEATRLLRERVKVDRSLRDKVESDFDKFCENECIAIETVLDLIERQSKVIEEIKNLDKMLMYDKYENDYKDVIDASKVEEILEGVL